MMEYITKTYRIKNMICTRCNEVVSEIFTNNHSKIISVDLGIVTVQLLENYNESTIKELLEKRGFEIIVDEEDAIVEQIKVSITKLFFHEKKNENLKNSAWLEDEIGIPYHKLCAAFSSRTDTTIEKYIILQKIERVKELINYNQMNFEEISLELGYKNLSHLSNQFKKIEKQSLSQYKKDISSGRTEIDKLI